MIKRIVMLGALSCVFAAETAWALDDPPVKPTYTRPTFERPVPPREVPPGDRPNPDRKRFQVTQSWDLLCKFERGTWQGKYNPLELTTMFSTRVDPSLYPAGAKVCRALSPSRDIAIRCENDGGDVNVTSNLALSAEETQVSKSFCYKVLSAL